MAKSDSSSSTKSSHRGSSPILALLAFGCIAAAGWMGFEVYQQRMTDTEHMDNIQTLISNVRDIRTLSEDTISGNPGSVGSIQDLRVSTERNLAGLRSSMANSYQGNHALEDAFTAVASDWSDLTVQLEVIETLKGALQNRFDLRDQIRSQISTLKESNNTISLALARGEGSPAQVYYATKQNQLLNDINSEFTDRSGSGTNTAALVNRYGKTLQALINGSGEDRAGRVGSPEIRQTLMQNAQLFSDLRASMEGVDGTASQIDRALTSADQVQPITEGLIDSLNRLYHTVDAAVTSRELNPQRTVIVGLSGFFFLIVFIVMAVRSNGERTREAIESKQMIEDGTRQRHEEMQRLVREIQPLTDGNLTTEASLDGTFTNQIAKVFNKAIASLRDIVARLKASSMEIASAAEQSHRTSENLKGVKARNERVIASSSDLAHKMDMSIDNICQHASETARSSSESARAVESGRQSVEKTHRAVEVADTSIRVSADMVKKLGEDIQQIESITMTIREITGNLQSLSYNTQLIADRSTGAEQNSISATADKMEELARTVYGSLEDITTIVNGIIGRASETQSHIEKSRVDFVDLVKNSNTTLESFQRIDEATTRSHENVRKIESEAQQLTSTSQRFIENISEIQKLSRESSLATEETTQAISKLTNLASDLQSHAAQFRIAKADGASSS